MELTISGGIVIEPLVLIVTDRHEWMPGFDKQKGEMYPRFYVLPVD